MQESIMNTDISRREIGTELSLFNTLYVSLSIKREPKIHYDVCQTRKEAFPLMRYS